MLVPSGGGLILYQAYGNLYAMTGRKVYLLEDKQIPSVEGLALGWHLEEIHLTWAYLEKKQKRLRLYTKNHEELCIQSVSYEEFEAIMKSGSDWGKASLGAITEVIDVAKILVSGVA
nr:hypothetical protein [Tanacetum cinerariifolium]